MSLRYILHSVILFPLLTLATPVRYIDVTKPGANLFEEPTCPDYATCAQVAQDYMNDLWTTIANPAAVDRDDGLEPFQQHYRCEPAHSNPAQGAGIRGDLALRGIALDKMFTWTTSLRDINTGIEDIIITYTNLFDTNKGVILAVENWHSLDSSGALTWSELVYQTWKVASDLQTKGAQTYAKDVWQPGGSISTLQHVIQSQIAEPGTLSVLGTAYRELNYPGANSGDQTWRRWREVDGLVKNWFFSILGTDACKGTIQLLKEHVVEIGRKEITEIWTTWSGALLEIWMIIEALPLSALPNAPLTLPPADVSNFDNM
ncbi:hypothetical protein XANCAGTX0491_003521 [Xanthoria calcicola]